MIYYLDDLEKVLFAPVETLTVIVEEIRGRRALVEIVGMRDLTEELFNLRMLYESDRYAN